MREKSLEIYCVYSDNGTSISEIMNESFVQYLKRTVAMPFRKAVQCPR